MKWIFTKQGRSKFIILLITFAIVIFGFIYFIIEKQSLGESIIAAFISFPLYSFLLGGMIAIFRFKGLNYFDRWITASLVILFIIESLFLIRVFNINNSFVHISIKESLKHNRYYNMVAL